MNDSHLRLDQFLGTGQLGGASSRLLCGKRELAASQGTLAETRASYSPRVDRLRKRNRRNVRRQLNPRNFSGQLHVRDIARQLDARDVFWQLHVRDVARQRDGRYIAWQRDGRNVGRYRQSRYGILRCGRLARSGSAAGCHDQGDERRCQHRYALSDRQIRRRDLPPPRCAFRLCAHLTDTPCRLSRQRYHWLERAETSQ